MAEFVLLLTKSNDMLDLLQRYFFLFHHLHLPGLGKLALVKTPPALHFAERQLTAPVFTVEWIPHAEGEEAPQVWWLAKQLMTDTLTVNASLESFCAEITSTLANGKTFNLPLIGRFSMTPTGNIDFSSSLDTAPYLAPVVAERVIRPEESHKVVVGNDERTSEEMEAFLSQQNTATQRAGWWWGALIILLIILVALGYHRMQNESPWQNKKHLQRIHLKDAPATYRQIQ